MATLHEHARQWSLPRGVDFPALTDVFWNMPDRLDAAHLDLEAADLAVIREAVGIVARVMSRIAGGLSRPLHADLHTWNVKWSRGRLAVFDFDDSGWGVPVQDLAVSTYYLLPRRDLVEAFREGYAMVTPLPGVASEDFEALLVQRNLLLLNDMLDTTNAQYRRLVPNYSMNTVSKIRHWLDTGIYRHDLDGLLPLS